MLILTALIYIYVTLEPKTNHKGPFFLIEIDTINNLSIDVWFVMIGQYLKIWNLRVQKNQNIEKIIFKVVQMKFLAMHITNQKLSFDIFMVGNVQNIFMEHDLNILMIFGIKEKSIIFDPYNVFLDIATIYNIAIYIYICVNGNSAIEVDAPLISLSLSHTHTYT